MAVLQDVIRGLQAECKNQCRQVDRTADYVQMKTAINNTILTRSRQSIETEWSRDQRECVEECHAVNKHLPKNLKTGSQQLVYINAIEGACLKQISTLIPP